MSVAERHEMLGKAPSCGCKDERKQTHISKSKTRRKHRRVFRIVLGLSIFANIVLFIFLVYLAIELQLTEKEVERTPHECSDGNDNLQLTDAKNNQKPNEIYSDLKVQEKHDVQRYLYTKTNLGIVPIERATMESTFIHSMELLDPVKETVNRFTNSDGPQYPREAKVTIMNTGLKHPLVEEYVIGPLGHFDSMRMRKLTESPTSSVSFRVRQFTFPEVLEMYLTLRRYKEIHDILFESYGATLFDCIDKTNRERCLVTYKSHVPIVYSSERKVWISFYYYMEYYSLHPIDFEILMNIQSSKSEDWKVDSIWYANKLYKSYEEFVSSYRNNSIPKLKLSFPVNDISNISIIGSLHRRVDLSFDKDKPRRGPVQFQPDGKRFSVAGQSVRYLNWQFDWKNTLVGGPQLHNLKFRNNSIAYEIGLQDIVVMYSGGSPAFSHAAFADGLNGLGSRTAGLVPGVDCPEYATMLNISVVTEDFLTDSVLPNAICIFEHNQGVPLRRHYVNSHGQAGVFYGGLVSTVLIFRTIFVINNYDYIMDYVFYENGVFETKIYPTGYVLASYSYEENSTNFGTHIDKNVIAPYHLHLFNFKVDIDILGTKNRYKTIDVQVQNYTSDVGIYSNGTQYRYRLEHSLKSNEIDAAVRTTESSSKYHIFYNEKYKNQFGDYRGYQVETKCTPEQLMPENYGFESSIKWSRYKMAVTKRKVGEERSSSMYASFDAGQPTVDFQKFIDDNDSIVDEDLVAWLTLGLHHIPHTEDVPNVATAGKEMSFTLIPFNFFPEDPSMSSSNAVRITPKDPTNSRKGLNIERYGTRESYDCIPESFNYNALRKDGSSIFYPLQG